MRYRFSALAKEQDVENHWVEVKCIYNETAQKNIGPRNKSKHQWISAKSWKLVEEGKLDGLRSMRLKILTDGVEVLPLNAENPTLNEIRSAIKDLKIRKVPGYDITNEPIRADLKTSVKEILLTKIWDDETRPTDWKKSPDSNIANEMGPNLLWKL